MALSAEGATADPGKGLSKKAKSDMPRRDQSDGDRRRRDDTNLMAPRSHAGPPLSVGRPDLSAGDRAGLGQRGRCWLRPAFPQRPSVANAAGHQLRFLSALIIAASASVTNSLRTRRSGARRDLAQTGEKRPPSGETRLANRGDAGPRKQLPKRYKGIARGTPWANRLRRMSSAS